MGDAAGDLLQDDRHFHAADILAHALMRAIPEGQVIGRIVAPDIQLIGVLEMARIVVGRGHHHQDLATLGDNDPRNISIAGGNAPPRDHGPGMAQTFLDRRRDQAGIVADRLPLRRMAKQLAQRIGGCERGGFMRGDDDRHHHRVQIAVGDDLGVVAVLADHVIHPAMRGLARIDARRHPRQHLARVVPELRHPFSHGDLLFGRGLAPGVDRMRDREAAQRHHVVIGHAQKLQRHRQRHVPQQILDQMGPAPVDDRIQLRLHQLAHHRDMRGKRFGCEGVQQQAAAGHMRRLVFVHQRAVHAVAFAGQHRQCLG